MNIPYTDKMEELDRLNILKNLLKERDLIMGKSLEYKF